MQTLLQNTSLITVRLRDEGLIIDAQHDLSIGRRLARGATPLMTLQLSDCHIGAAGLKSLADAGARGGLPNLITLELRRNIIADEGVASLADCVEHGGLPKLTTLDLRVNHVGDAGLRSLADACAAGGLPLLSKLLVVYNHITLIGFTALSDAKARGGLSRLKELLVHSMDGLEPECQRVWTWAWKLVMVNHIIRAINRRAKSAGKHPHWPREARPRRPQGGHGQGGLHHRARVG